MRVPKGKLRAFSDSESEVNFVPDSVLARESDSHSQSISLDKEQLKRVYKPLKVVHPWKENNDDGINPNAKIVKPTIPLRNVSKGPDNGKGVENSIKNLCGKEDRLNHER